MIINGWVGRLLALSFLMAPGLALSQAGPAPALDTEYVFTIEAGITDALVMGETVDGTRRAVPITGGTVRGEAINGEVVPGGADYQVDRSDGSTMLRAVYMIRTTDGFLINVINEGLLVPPGTIGNDSLYFRTTPRFTAPNGKYGWLNNQVFVSAVRLSADKPDTVIIDVYKVL